MVAIGGRDVSVINHSGSSINDVTALGRMDIKDFVTILKRDNRRRNSSILLKIVWRYLWLRMTMWADHTIHSGGHPPHIWYPCFKQFTKQFLIISLRTIFKEDNSNVIVNVLRELLNNGTIPFFGIKVQMFYYTKNRNKIRIFFCCFNIIENNDAT